MTLISKKAEGLVVVLFGSNDFMRLLLDKGGKGWKLFWKKYGLFFKRVCHSDTKPSSIDSQRIRAAKCHVW